MYIAFVFSMEDRVEAFVSPGELTDVQRRHDDVTKKLKAQGRTTWSVILDLEDPTIVLRMLSGSKLQTVQRAMASYIQLEHVRKMDAIS